MVWWEIIFMLVVLKIPVVYLCAVVWWAIRAEPLPDDGTSGALDGGPDERGPRQWWRPPRRRKPGPHGSPVRVPARSSRSGFARGRVER